MGVPWEGDPRTRLSSEEKLLLRTCLKRHYELVKHYRAPWDRAIDQVLEEVEAGTLVPPEGLSPADRPR